MPEAGLYTLRGGTTHRSTHEIHPRVHRSLAVTGEVESVATRASDVVTIVEDSVELGTCLNQNLPEREPPSHQARFTEHLGRTAKLANSASPNDA